ncbi:hypothetical protein J5N97_005319 [Dioscorea zingiberensis]|uniref:Disease resistance protein n=1 Tax=Dioscorea zingiberensis TaxID=325984 RepID=A0A9D5D9Z6_9LILI|nr:hypothetical protein J5N97_005319 [Dioscorea zingiberensis]
MAEAAVSSVVQKLGVLIMQEAKELHGVRGQVEWLQEELRSMQCFLKDADAKRARGDERVKNWVRNIRDVAYEAEDIIDTFMLKVSRRRRKKGFFNCIKRCVFIFNELIAKHEVSTEIQGIKDKLADISNRRQQYGIANIDEIGGTSNQSRVQPVIPLLPELQVDKDVVGFDDEKEVIVNQLVDESNKDRLVISIVGMGGLGKTTLTKSIYNSPTIKRSFDMHAWVTISQEYKPIEIVRKILSKITSISEDKLEKDIETLSIKLCETLKKGKYLIVLDDVWRTEVWDELKIVFPDVTNGSRVIITTRFLNVAEFADPTTKPHELRFLNEQESWQLFLNNAFPRQNIATCCPADLVDVARQLVQRCSGLPLALVVLGGLMSTKGKDYNSWNTVATDMRWQYVEGGERCLEILALSYNDLSYYLKSCFLYFGLFPEDYDISETVLCKLWAAEGFFPVMDGKTLEETAKAHIEELVQRCMVQVTRRRYDGSVRSCRVHDLLRDKCISEAKEGRVFEIYNNNATNGTTSTSCDVRRLVVYDEERELETLSYSNVKLRGIFSFKIVKDEWLSATVHGFKFLRVIQLYRSALISEFPSEIKFLIHLRYLGFWESTVKIIPSWIDNLYNLQTIDMRDIRTIDMGYTSIKTISDSLWGIESLRHVNVQFDAYKESMPVPPEMRLIPKNLQTLKVVVAGAWIENVLPKLKNLRKLYIKRVSHSHANALSISLQELGRLVSLRIDGYGVPSDNIIKAFSNQVCLSKLFLSGPFINKEQLPSFSEFPKNLMKIIFEDSELEQDPMPTLEKLPYLRDLKLWSAYEGKHMICSAKGFPQLLSLEMNQLDGLEEWKIEEEAMPSLKYLELEGCSGLKMIPEGLRNVTTLDELKLINMPGELETRIKENSGEDWYKIKHVPKITATYWRLW